MISRFKHHKYTYSMPWGSPRHMWELVGPDGGIHFHVTLVKDYSPSCGLEFHHANKQRDEAPSQLECWLTGGRCWHDGTSSYASELWPLIQMYLKDGKHEEVFRILEHEYDQSSSLGTLAKLDAAMEHTP